MHKNKQLPRMRLLPPTSRRQMPRRLIVRTIPSRLLTADTSPSSSNLQKSKNSRRSPSNKNRNSRSQLSQIIWGLTIHSRALAANFKSQSSWMSSSIAPNSKNARNQPPRPLESSLQIKMAVMILTWVALAMRLWNQRERQVIMAFLLIQSWTRTLSAYARTHLVTLSTQSKSKSNEHAVARFADLPNSDLFLNTQESCVIY